MLAVLNTIQNTFPPHRMVVPGGDRPHIHATAPRRAGAPVLPSDKIQHLAELLCGISQSEYDDLGLWVSTGHCISEARAMISVGVH